MPAMIRASLLTAAAVAVAFASAIVGCGDNFESPDPDTVVVDPTSVTLQIGETRGVSAMFQKHGAAFTSSAVMWDSSNPRAATVDASGNSATITAVAPGTTTITASGFEISATIAVTVAPAAPTRIEISPVNPVVAAGVIVPVHVTAFLNDGSNVEVTQDVTWTSMQPAVATVAGSQLKGLVKGDATISALYKDKYSSTAVTVTGAVLRSIAISPTLPSIAVGSTEQFTATGHYSDLTIQDLTATATWASASATTAMIAAGGLATAVAVGTSAISATLGSVVGSTTLAVTP
jgi:hypothetical protein